MNDTKAWYYSRTIWGALIAVFAPLLQLLGMPISQQMQPELAEAIVILVGAIGGFVALLGRLLATRQLR